MKDLTDQIQEAIRLLDVAFKAISDQVQDDDDPRMKDYQTMIRGAVITKNALARFRTAHEEYVK